MADEKKVLMVTDYAGNMHITPFNNRGYYLQTNHRNRQRTDLQFKIHEMGEKEALKYHADNQGIDPNFVAPKDTQSTFELQKNKIEELEKKLAALQNPTVPQVQEQIKHAQTPEEVSHIAAPYDEKAIDKAADDKVKEMSKDPRKK